MSDWDGPGERATWNDNPKPGEPFLVIDYPPPRLDYFSATERVTDQTDDTDPTPGFVFRPASTHRPRLLDHVELKWLALVEVPVWADAAWTVSQPTDEQS